MNERKARSGRSDDGEVRHSAIEKPASTWSAMRKRKLDDAFFSHCPVGADPWPFSGWEWWSLWMLQVIFQQLLAQTPRKGPPVPCKTRLSSFLSHNTPRRALHLYREAWLKDGSHHTFIATVFRRQYAKCFQPLLTRPPPPTTIWLRQLSRFSGPQRTGPIPSSFDYTHLTPFATKLPFVPQTSLSVIDHFIHARRWFWVALT